MGPAHVQMGRVEPLEEANVIKTLRLQNLDAILDKMLLRTDKKKTQEETQTNAYLIIFSLEQTLIFLLWRGLPLNLASTT